eukprot:CAMPEP_0175042430 /NCGR_PEP_ID=MMETSP0052_2-20121109/2566_1 /TAXON_ID=51329 ORGANISM="Polytomella parva, Strain SAG 63-3" /NCGR_SAMPLE_ID=MMETSP0052_2 /ASSEMBLY_ACC=CAM_ASM_000194 /LENGTH=270 /DNA_ID=CAMNT_0016305255 /DNA_START=470 /DNA_END=1282 /DNA_ORIENTATION=-
MPPPQQPMQVPLSNHSSMIPIKATTTGMLSSLSTTNLPSYLNENRGNVSHSTVEKLRRDRINSLIDELRELVPPQKISPSQRSDNLESRRPKHIVLADTIALLRNLQLNKDSLVGASLILNGTKAEEQCTSDTSKGSSTLEDGDIISGAPQLPYIPCQLTQYAGVAVEKGPECYYVQVKCRDRKGLLSDIINALKMLPIEIRTAAVTTTGDGTVRDVFEIRVDDASLGVEEIQNMVHDALFQNHFSSSSTTGVAPSGTNKDEQVGKRLRS